MKVAVLAGSLRREAFSRKMARELIALAPDELKLEIVDIGGLPLYNQDYDDDGKPPSVYKAFRKRIKEYDGILFVTPEYNRSVPAVLKNAIDVGSMPYGQSVWEGKPAGIVSVSPGAIGGFGANHHLRQSLVFLDMPTMQQPEAYIGGAASLFDAEGKLTNEGTRKFLRKFMESYAAWLKTNSKAV